MAFHGFIKRSNAALFNGFIKKETDTKLIEDIKLILRVDGTNGSSIILDSSDYAHTPDSNSGCTLSTLSAYKEPNAQTALVINDTIGNGLIYPSNATNLAFGSGEPWNIEFFSRSKYAGASLAIKKDSLKIIEVGASNIKLFDDDITGIWDWSVSLVHVRLTYDGNVTYKLYQSGTTLIKTYITNTYIDKNSQLSIIATGGTLNDMHLSQLRISTGIAYRSGVTAQPVRANAYAP